MWMTIIAVVVVWYLVRRYFALISEQLERKDALDLERWSDVSRKLEKIQEDMKIIEDFKTFEHQRTRLLSEIANLQGEYRALSGEVFSSKIDKIFKRQEPPTSKGTGTH
jgi:hypothetical protein